MSPSTFCAKSRSILASLFVLSFLLQQPSSAQGAGFEDPEQSRVELKRQIQNQEQSMVGKTFYGYFNRLRCRYTDGRVQSSPSTISRGQTYVAEGSKRFIINGIVPDQSSTFSSVYRYYRVAIEDGTVGFIRTGDFERELGYSMRRVNGEDEYERERMLREEGCYFDIEPSEVESRLAAITEARERKAAESRARYTELKKQGEEAAAENAKKEAEEEAYREALRKRPNARIGMTAKQVIEKTRWGQPDSVNRLVTKNGIREQWVYGDSNYLYFENGRLSAMQY